MSERSERLFAAMNEISEGKIDEAVPVDEALAERILAEAAQVERTPEEAAQAERTSAEVAQVEGTPEEAAQAERTPAETVPTEGIPKEGARRLHWKRWTVFAAALALVVGAGSYIGLRMGNNGDTFGNSAGAAGTDGGAVFMSYAGPVFPLALKVADNSITAEREITLDFIPWIGEWRSNEEEADRENVTPERRQEILEQYNERFPAGGYYISSKDIQVTDTYLLTNASGEDRTVSVLYPFAGDLRDLEGQQPVLTVGGERLETVLHAGGYSGGFAGADGMDSGERWNLAQPASWEQYKALLEDGGYQKAAFDAYPDLSDVPAIIYEFAHAQGTDGEAPTIQAAFYLDYAKTTVLSFHFNGGSYRQEAGWMGRDYFIPQPGRPDYDAPRYLIVLGDDVRDMTVQGYENGACEPDERIEASVEVKRYEASLEDILREVAWEMYTSWWDGPGTEDFEMFFGLMKGNLLAYGILSENPAERYGFGQLEELDFHYMKRVFYLEAEVTVPAGGDIMLEAEMLKERSCDYYCAHTENQGVYGYDMVTKLGSNLNYTRQTAVLEDRGQIEIVRQNFGFDLENGVKIVVLDAGVEHYYLEVKEREDFQKPN